MGVYFHQILNIDYHMFILHIPPFYIHTPLKIWASSKVRIFLFHSWFIKSVFNDWVPVTVFKVCWRILVWWPGIKKFRLLLWHLIIVIKQVAMLHIHLTLGSLVISSQGLPHLLPGSGVLGTTMYLNFNFRGNILVDKG